MSLFRLAVAQSFCVTGDISGNLTRMEPLVQEATAAKARVVLFCETGVTGYSYTAPRIALGDEHYEALQAMAKRHSIIIVAGFFEQNGTHIHNTQGVFRPDGSVLLQRKGRLATIESTIPGFLAGSESREIFEIDGVRCAVAICADMAIPDLYDQLVNNGVQLLLVPTAGCGPREKGYSLDSLEDPVVFERYLKDAESVVFSSNAIRMCHGHRIAMACCNQMADNGVDCFHPGHSMIVDGSGELVALIPGTFVFEHLRPRVIIGEIQPRQPRHPLA